MDNIIIEGLYSDIFSCHIAYKSDIQNIDEFFDIITQSLIPTFGIRFNFYVTSSELVVKSPRKIWIQEVVGAFSNIQKKLDAILHSPVRITTGWYPNPVYWEVIVKNGKIHSSKKIS